MAQRFEERYPEYALIPSKEAKWKAPLVLGATVLGLVLAGYALFRELSQLDVPIAAMAGINANSVNTLKSLALTQAKSGQYESAAKNFDDYFKLGGDDEEAKRAAAFVKEQLRQKHEAR